MNWGGRCCCPLPFTLLAEGIWVCNILGAELPPPVARSVSDVGTPLLKPDVVLLRPEMVLLPARQPPRPRARCSPPAPPWTCSCSWPGAPAPRGSRGPGPRPSRPGAPWWGAGSPCTSAWSMTMVSGIWFKIWKKIWYLSSNKCIDNDLEYHLIIDI